jgi:hypothetical protein
MECSHIADGADGLLISKVAANILNTQRPSRQVVILQLGVWAKCLTVKFLYETMQKGSELGQILWNDVCYEKWIKGHSID